MFALNSKKSLLLKIYVNNSLRFIIDKKQPDIKCYSDGPLKTLHKKIENNELKHDSHQEKVILSLQEVYDNVNKTKLGGGGFFNWKKTVMPKGLYIYGSVGGGKTMLMDLFYDCCDKVSARI